MADFDETGENKTEYEYIPRTNVVRSQKLPNGSKFAYGHDVDDTVTGITQSTEEGEENSTHTRYTCGEVTDCARIARGGSGRAIIFVFLIPLFQNGDNLKSFPQIDSAFAL